MSKEQKIVLLLNDQGGWFSKLRRDLFPQR